MGTTPTYATREGVQRALDAAETTRLGWQIDEQLAAATEAINDTCHRTFYPHLATHYFDWPNRQFTAALYLDEHDLISITSLVSGGVTIAADDYFLMPRDGPPFAWIEIDRGSSAAFQAGLTSQSAIAITGWYGWRDSQIPAGTLTAGIDSDDTLVDLSDGSTWGVGDLLTVGTERLVVTDRLLIDSGENIAGALTLSSAERTVPVADGTDFHTGEEIVVDAESMLIEQIAGNNLLVRRAYAGSALAAHSNGADIYVGRRAAVTRAAVGTTAAAALLDAAVTRWAPPAFLRRWCIAKAMVGFGLEQAGYAGTAGQGAGASDPAGGGIGKLEYEAWATFARKARISAI